MPKQEPGAAIPAAAAEMAEEKGGSSAFGPAVDPGAAGAATATATAPASAFHRGVHRGGDAGRDTATPPADAAAAVPPETDAFSVGVFQQNQPHGQPHHPMAYPMAMPQYASPHHGGHGATATGMTLQLLDAKRAEFFGWYVNHTPSGPPSAEGGRWVREAMGVCRGARPRSRVPARLAAEPPPSASRRPWAGGKEKARATHRCLLRAPPGKRHGPHPKRAWQA